jgi:hypothetical protein
LGEGGADTDFVLWTCVHYAAAATATSTVVVATIVNLLSFRVVIAPQIRFSIAGIPTRCNRAAIRLQVKGLFVL